MTTVRAAARVGLTLAAAGATAAAVLTVIAWERIVRYRPALHGLCVGCGQEPSGAWPGLWAAYGDVCMRERLETSHGEPADIVLARVYEYYPEWRVRAR